MLTLHQKYKDAVTVFTKEAEVDPLVTITEKAAEIDEKMAKKKEAEARVQAPLSEQGQTEGENVPYTEL